MAWYSEFLERRLHALRLLAAGFREGRAVLVALDEEEIQRHIAQQEDLCAEIRFLDREWKSLQPKFPSACAGNQGRSDLSPLAERLEPVAAQRLRRLLGELSAAQAEVQRLNRVHAALLQRSRRIINVLMSFLANSSPWEDIEKVKGALDRILELRMRQETRRMEKLESLLGAMRQVEALLNPAKGGLSCALNDFFQSLRNLQRDSAESGSLSRRQATLIASQNLADALRTAAHNLAALRSRLDQKVTQAVHEINRLAAEVAELNGCIAELEKGGQDAAALAGRRNLLLRQLSDLVDIAVAIEESGSLGLPTAHGAAPAGGKTTVALRAQLDPATGLQYVFAQDAAITPALSAGRIGGWIEFRDQTIPSILAELGTVAASLADAGSILHRAGSDDSAAAGGDSLAPPPESGMSAAAVLPPALTQPAPAAESGSASDSTANPIAMAAVGDPAMAGRRALDVYASLLSRIQNELASYAVELEAQGLVLQQLERHRSALSEVSLEEEAANLIRYQRAFEAAARMVAAVDELPEAAPQISALKSSYKQPMQYMQATV